MPHLGTLIATLVIGGLLGAILAWVAIRDLNGIRNRQMQKMERRKQTEDY